MLEKMCGQIDTQQFGGIKGRSTAHALTSMLHLWSEVLDCGDSVRILFVEYCKAFYCIDYTLLINKLISFGIPNFIVKWIYSFLYERKQRIKLNNSFSDWITLKGSMPQGTWLGSLTFIAFIIDLIAQCPCHKFIDNVTLTEILKNNTPSATKEITDELIKWSHDNKMLINCNKTKELIIGNAKLNNTPYLEIDGKLIRRVSEYKIRGLQLSNNLYWNCNIDLICNKISSYLYFLKLFKRSGLPIEDLHYVYITVFDPCWSMHALSGITTLPLH